MDTMDGLLKEDSNVLDMMNPMEEEDIVNSDFGSN
jgi:hypothetical protein